MNLAAATVVVYVEGVGVGSCIHRGHRKWYRYKLGHTCEPRLGCMHKCWVRAGAGPGDPSWTKVVVMMLFSLTRSDTGLFSPMRSDTELRVLCQLGARSPRTQHGPLLDRPAWSSASKQAAAEPARHY